MKASAIGLLTAALACSGWAGDARELVETAGVRGGLVVVLGSDVELLGGFGPGYVVQGLDGDSKGVEKAREALRTRGLYGPITVRHWTAGHLPYADGVVNLIVSGAPHRVSREELERVLAPRGVAVALDTQSATPDTRRPARVDFRRAVPAAIDDWTHFLHGSDNNAVARDSVVGPPRYLRWTGGPKYSRNHEIDASVVAVVSAKGRFVYVVDEGLPGFMGKYLPQTWSLVARDAFSGVILWKRSMPEMGWPQWKPVMGDTDWTKLVAQRRLIPITLPRRVVASGDRVFAVLSYHAPLSILDAATGKTLRTVDGTTGTDEVLFHEGRLVLSVRPRSRGSLDKKKDALAVINRSDKLVTNHPGNVMAVDPDNGEILWKVSSSKLLPLSLTGGRGRVFFHTGSEVVCLDGASGKGLWRAPNKNEQSFRWNVPHTLVAHEDVLLVGTPRTLAALSAKTGELLWSGKGGRNGFAGSNPVNLYVIDGLVWAPAGLGKAEGRDPRTGEVKRAIELPAYMYTAGHHFRCYRGKATERYLLENKRGIEMIDLKGDNFVKNDWVRGMCRYGIVPCNGMIYSTPTPCSCYPAALLTGFNALAAERKSTGQTVDPLQKGPAFGAIPDSQSRNSAGGDWPRFRNNTRMTGVGATEVGTSLKQKWQAQLGGKLTQPVVADGKLLVASVDTHTVHALDPGSGKTLWSYTLDGRVDSPPTCHGGVVYFGSANGWLYAVRAGGGELVWRYRVAPGDDQVVSYNQLESVWPARGSVLVLDDVVYAAAGRNSYLDGGIFLVGLEAVTGRKLHEARLKNRHQDPAKDKGQAHVIDGATLDVLTSDGEHVIMQGAVFDRTLKRVSGDAWQTPGIYASGGFIDDLAWNRNAWRCGAGAASLQLNKKNLAGMPCTGQLLVFDDELVYGVKYFLGHSGQSAVFYPGQDGYKLFAQRIGAEEKTAATRSTGKKKRKRRGGSGFNPAWQLMLSVRVRAMTKAADTLFVAGPPDVVDPNDPMAAFEGRKGAILKAYSAGDGKELAEMKLDVPPVFDGLIAANGRLYMSTVDGCVVCLGE